MNAGLRWAQIREHEARFLYVESQIIGSSPSHVKINREKATKHRMIGREGNRDEGRRDSKLYSLSGT